MPMPPEPESGDEQERACSGEHWFDRECGVAKVRAAADRLGYPGPHPGARSLRRGRAGSLGVILGERLTYAFDDPQAARFLAGVAEVCAAEGVGLTLVPTTGAASDVQHVAEAVVDGFVVWTTSDDDPVLDAVAASGLPAVVHAGPCRPGLPVVGIDDRACLLYTSPSPRDGLLSRMPSSA